MRILFVALTMPYPPTSGHRLRAWAMLQALAQDGHQLRMLILAIPGENLDWHNPLYKVCESVETVAAPRAQAGDLARIRSLFCGLPHGAWRLRCPELTRRIVETIARESIDLLFCDGVYNVINVPELLPAPVLLDADDGAHLIVQRYLLYEHSPLKRLYGSIEARKMRRLETWACRRATALLACSENSKRLFQRLAPGAQIFVSPNVVDTEVYTPTGTGEPGVLLYQGGMDWRPNRDAVEFFVSAILPELRRPVQQFRFVVAGRSPTEEFRRRFAGVPGIEFTGTVPDMREEIAKATVCVVPLRIGSGTRLKILEAAAMAKPVVSTTLGAEGLEFVDGQEIVLADEPQAFARAVATLLADAGRRRALGQAARRRVEQQYSLPVLRRAVRLALAELQAPAARARAGLTLSPGEVQP